MTPYFEKDGIAIYHADCLEMLPFMGCILVTDPPYGMAYKSGWSGASVTADDDTKTRDRALAMSQYEAAAVFGRWSVPRPKETKMVLVWDKGAWPGMGDLSMPWGPSHEEIYILGEGFAGKREGSVIRHDRIGGNGIHPTEKPVALMRYLIERCPPGVVLDPFMGAGSTLVAARDLGRRAIGIEIEERYCEIAAKRLSQNLLPFGTALSPGGEGE